MAERTEPASAKRKRQARERGQVARSDDLSSGLQLLAGAAVLSWFGPGALTGLASFTARILRTAPTHPLSAALALRAGLETCARTLLPGLAVLGATGALVAFAQVGPGTSPRTIEPDLARLDPVAGLRRLWSARSLYGLAKNLVKLALVGFVLWVVLSDLLPTIGALAGARPALVGWTLGEAAVRLLVRGGAALVAIGFVDLLYQRFRLAQDLRMTKEEVRREVREEEGDPQHKAHRARAHHEVLAHARIEDVRFADVVVVNPEHIAVALKYAGDEMDAPKVVAKGDHLVAKQIIEVARAHGVPIVRDVALARALRDLEIDQEIPEDLYDAVAEVLRVAYAEREDGGDPREGDAEPR